MDLLVVAKAPVPGRVKTRLCPPCTPGEAADIAAAALADTFSAAISSRADRVLLVLDGEPGAWCPPGVRVVPQGEGDLGARLAQAWTCTGGPAVQIGMDTPQVSATDLDAAMDLLAARDVDAVLGPAADGGWWALGLRRPLGGVFEGVPMSTPRTAVAQHERLVQLGQRVAALPVVRDVDTWADALQVAASAPDLRTARAVARAGAGAER